MLGQIVDRLNHWVQGQSLPADWQPDPMLRELPEPLARLPLVQQIARKQFVPYDGYVLQEALWLREVAARVRGETHDELAAAERLFDWTVRNIQLEIPRPDRLPQLPWETLFFGRGTALERAWVFVLLARQEHLDAFLLGVPEPGDAEAPVARPWWVGVLIEGKVYLFEPALGLPIPAAHGLGLSEDGTLHIRPATLGELTADESLLRRLDLEPGDPYPLRAEELGRLVAFVEAAPWNLSARMQLLESHLAGEHALKLVASPSAQARRLRQCERIAQVRLWRRPFEVLMRRQAASRDEVRRALLAWLHYYTTWPWDSPHTLARARVLHLKGRFEGDHGAIKAYQVLRLSEEQLEQIRREMLKLVKTMAEQQKQPGASAAGQPIGAIPDPQTAAREVELRIELLRQVKLDATYWLGIVVFEQGNYEAAIDWFSERTLAPAPEGPWAFGAHYNLGRAYEAAGRPREAISEYLANTNSPSHYGEFLRARWLDQLLTRKAQSAVQSAGHFATAQPATVLEQRGRFAGPRPRAVLQQRSRRCGAGSRAAGREIRPGGHCAVSAGGGQNVFAVDKQPGGARRGQGLAARSGLWAGPAGRLEKPSQIR